MSQMQPLVLSQITQLQSRSLPYNERWSPPSWHHRPYRIPDGCYNVPLLTWFCSGISELFTPVSRYSIRSTHSNHLVHQPARMSTYEGRSFTVCGPTVWNSLPDYLRDPSLSLDSFRRFFENILLSFLITFCDALVHYGPWWLCAI